MKLIQAILLGLAALIVGCTSVETSVGDSNKSGKEITLFYQSNRFGSFEPCGCHTTPFGGLDRETNLITEAKQKSNAVAYLDSGNMLVPPELKVAIEVYQSRAEIIAEMLDKTGLTVFSPGETDLKLGVEFLQGLSKKTKFSFVSSNIQDEKGNLAFQPYQVLNLEGVRLGVLAVSPNLPKKGFQVRPWKEAISQYLPEVQAKSDVVVVLSQLKAVDADQLAKDFPQVALLIGGDEKLSLDSPNWTNHGKTLILDPGINGFSIGKLVWHLQLPFQGSHSQSEVNENRGKIIFYEEKLKTEPNNVLVKNEMKYLTEVAQNDVIAGGSSYEHEMMKLTAEKYGQSNEVTALMKNSKEKLKQFLVARSKKRIKK